MEVGTSPEPSDKSSVQPCETVSKEYSWAHLDLCHTELLLGFFLISVIIPFNVA